MKPINPCEFQLKGLKLEGWQTAPEKKGCILALHGWLDNANSFLPLAAHLDPDYQLISIDLVGHGKSEWRATGASYHFIDYVTDVLSLCEELNNHQNIFILGHSLGAAIATLVASCPPKNLKKCVLIDGLGPLSCPEELVHSRYLQFLKSHKKLSQQKTHYYKSFEEVLEKRLKASPMNKDAAKLILERSLKQDKNGWSWNSDPRHMAKNPMRLSEAQVLNFLENIQTPSLMIEAQKGEYYNFRYNVLNERLNKAKHIQHLSLEGEHHIHCDKPKEIAQHINNFINS